jgi:hypothetical protein
LTSSRPPDTVTPVAVVAVLVAVRALLTLASADAAPTKDSVAANATRAAVS